MAKLDIVNLVYGEKFTRFFVDISLPSQLSPGNIPSLRDRGESCYNIYTTAADAATIQAAPSYRLLATLMPVNLVILSAEQIRSPEERAQQGLTVWSVLSMVHKMAIEQTRTDHLVFLAPDWVISDGSLGMIERRLDQGYEAIVISAPRTEWEGAEPLFRSWVVNGEYLALPGRVLVDIMLKHLHWLHQALTHDMRWYADVIRVNWPSLMLWRHPEIGFIVHSAHLHPVAVKRSSGHAGFTTTIDGDYLSRFAPGTDKIYFATDSDELCISDITPRGYGQEYRSDQPLGIFYLAHWIQQNTTPINRWFMEKSFLFKSSGCKDEVMAACSDISRQRTANLLTLCRSLLGLSS